MYDVGTKVFRNLSTTNARWDFTCPKVVHLNLLKRSVDGISANKTLSGEVTYCGFTRRLQGNVVW